VTITYVPLRGAAVAALARCFWRAWSRDICGITNTV